MSRSGEYDMKYGFIPDDDCEKPMTNGDRIRAMSDEELAELFRHLCCPYLLGAKVGCNAKNKGCFDCWLDWLKQEVKGNA